MYKRWLKIGGFVSLFFYLFIFAYFSFCTPINPLTNDNNFNSPDYCNLSYPLSVLFIFMPILMLSYLVNAQQRGWALRFEGFPDIVSMLMTTMLAWFEFILVLALILFLLQKIIRILRH